MTNALLVLNAGSSSLKFALYEAADLGVLCRGSVSGLGSAPRFAIGGARAAAFEGAVPPVAAEPAAVAAWLLALVSERLPDLTLAAAGHRVVHGGMRHAAPALVTDDLLRELEGLIELAPLHEPHNLAAIRAVAEAAGDLPQVACFDTQFHRTQPRLAQLFGLPRALTESGILRYGFHGLSYEFIAGELPKFAGARADGRVIVAHLGSGASLCAMGGRRSVATSMGFSALDGLMMGTRCGNIDPGVLLHLMRRDGMDAAALADLLYNRSGLLGVSGTSSDVRVLEASPDPRCAEALELFAYRAAREIGALMAVLGGLDVLVFTAGVGEHSARVRSLISERLAWAGVALAGAANAANASRISAPGAMVDVLVIPTDEEIVVAKATQALVITAAAGTGGL